MYEYRYYIAFFIFIFCIIFEINGSSISLWTAVIKSNVTDDGLILGDAKEIRSDEWAVYTPMMLSQVVSGFKYFSEILRATSTDVFMIYGLPVLNIVQIFRPFQIGFLFLGAAKGLSFFWCGRLIALFLVTFEFIMLLTNKDKLLSLIGAIMITLAPIVQWWFAVNGIVEIFIFGELAILLLDKYMLNSGIKKRIIYLLGLVICAGGYIMVIYPAWQVPMFYVFLSLAIWIIIKNRKQFKIKAIDIVLIVIAVCIFALLMGYILYNSYDTIKTVMNTAYPGDRQEVGGGYGRSYVYYIMNIFFPYKSSGIVPNTCENAMMFTLFPIGIILSLYILLKEKKRDICIILMLIVYIFLGVWVCVGFPEIIAKITLMSNSQASRSILAVGFLDVLILLRALKLKEADFSKKNSFCFSYNIITICSINL